MKLDIAKTVAIAISGLRKLSPMQAMLAVSVGFVIFAMCWYYFFVTLAFEEMKSQRKDALEALESTRKAADSLLQSLPDARGPLPRLEESPANPEPQKADREQPRQQIPRSPNE